MRSTSAVSVTLDALVDDVFQVLDAYDVATCVLAGESLGGFVAMHAALRDPARFDALVLVAAPHLSRAVSRRKLSKIVPVRLSSVGWKPREAVFGRRPQSATWMLAAQDQLSGPKS